MKHRWVRNDSGPLKKVKHDLGNELTKKGKILPSMWKAGAQDQGTHAC